MDLIQAYELAIEKSWFLYFDFGKRIWRAGKVVIAGGSVGPKDFICFSPVIGLEKIRELFMRECHLRGFDGEIYLL